MKKALRTLFFIQFILFVPAFSKNIPVKSALIAKNEPEKISETIEKKNKSAKEAILKAKEAEQEAHKAQEEADKYTKLLKGYENNNSNLYQDLYKAAKKKVDDFIIEVNKQRDIQTTQEKEAAKLQEEITTLSKLQKEEEAIEAGFNEAKTPMDKRIEDEFRDCIQKFIEEHLKNPPKNNDTYKKELALLSEKLKELEIYERSNFYKSSSITNEQWQKIHEDVLNDRGVYEAKYKKILEAIQQTKDAISRLTKKQDNFLPASNETKECFVEHYPGIDKDLNRLEKAIETENEADSSPWGVLIQP